MRIVKKNGMFAVVRWRGPFMQGAYLFLGELRWTSIYGAHKHYMWGTRGQTQHIWQQVLAEKEPMEDCTMQFLTDWWKKNESKTEKKPSNGDMPYRDTPLSGQNS